ncbi:MAG: hypothetical protein NC337_08335 [Roseburia sp.]|nr:hypothetical protein [Roseburia sp.]
MNRRELLLTIIGGADGPTAVFVAGEFGMGFLLFVAAVLLLAAILIFWRPGVRTKYRFLRLSVGNLLIHLMDGLITFVNTPDLAMEGNPLVSRWGLGWGALFTANLIGFILIVLAAWYFNRYEYERIPSKGVFDYYMKLFYGEDYRPRWFWYKPSKNYRAMAALLSYSLYWGLTAAAPYFVIDWMLHMYQARPWWWPNKWGAILFAVLVAYGCAYCWVRAGYRQSAGKAEE